MGFQSTLSLRRATRAAASTYHSGYYFNPRSPCGERQVQSCLRQLRKYFNPRSPCGERHYLSRAKVNRFDISIHALLAESDLNPNSVNVSLAPISIHALLAESDLQRLSILWMALDFNPRSPCGERPSWWLPSSRAERFQSTLSLRRATRGGVHTARRNGDFNPRSPCGERRHSLFPC